MDVRAYYLKNTEVRKQIPFQIINAKMLSQ
jgi:hypothetical protein